MRCIDVIPTHFETESIIVSSLNRFVKVRDNGGSLFISILFGLGPISQLSLLVNDVS